MKIRTTQFFLFAAGALSLSQMGMAQATITWGSAQDTTGPSDVAAGGTVVEARTGLVFVGYLTGDSAFDATVGGVTFDAINYLGASFVNEPPNSFIANHTSGDPDYDLLLGNLSSCDGATLGNGSTNTSANYEITGLTVNEDYLVQLWYTDVRGISDGREIVVDGLVTLESGQNADMADLGQFVVGSFTATAATQTINVDANGTSGRVALTAILVRVDNGGGLGTNYCGPGPANSTGASGVMSASGSVVASANNLTVTASSLPPSQFGIFVTSRTQGFIPNAGGTSNGNICLGGVIGRFFQPSQILSTGSTGEFSLQLPLASFPQGNGTVAVIAGDTWNFQAWHRDSVGLGSNFTDGYEVQFQ